MELTPLAPLQASAEFWDDIDETSIESELKQLFIALFEHFYAPSLGVLIVTAILIY